MRPLGFEHPYRLAKRFPLIDIDYKPVFAHPDPIDPAKSIEPFVDANLMWKRITFTVEQLLMNYGQTNGQILLVTHAPVVNFIHKMVTGHSIHDRRNAIKVSSVSKFVYNTTKSASAPAPAPDSFEKRFVPEFVADLTHLTHT